MTDPLPENVKASIESGITTQLQQHIGALTIENIRLSRWCEVLEVMLKEKQRQIDAALRNGAESASG